MKMVMGSPDRSLTDRPLAAGGLESYRYPSRHGWIMIGARDDSDALREAARCLSAGERSELGKLQKWNGANYASVEVPPSMGASASMSNPAAIIAQPPPIELLKSLGSDQALASDETIHGHMAGSVIRASIATAGLVHDGIQDAALLGALLRGHRGQDLTSLTETEWISVMEEAEAIQEGWRREAADSGVPEDAPSLEWNGFDRPSEY